MAEVCSIDSCGEQVSSLSLCNRHYLRLRRHGDPLDGGPIRRKPSTCSIDGCDNKSYGRGWCPTHYQRWYEYGDPEVVKVKHGTALERLRFMSKEVASGCWEWQGHLDKGGYGRLVDDNGWLDMAHRLSYKLNVGPIPDGLVIHHKCNNPPCVNPRHLVPATSFDNLITFGLTNLGAVNSRKTHCSKGHEYTPENTYTRPGHSARYCRACNRENSKVQNVRKYLVKIKTRWVTIVMLDILRQEGAIQ